MRRGSLWLLIISVWVVGCGAKAPSEPGRSEPAGRESAVSDADQETRDTAASGAASPAADGPAMVAKHYPGLHNLMRVSDRIFSGSEPAGEAAFQALAELGVKTVVSVDGARPNIEEARKAGLRYVHIPIGYDGVSDEAGAALARVVRDADGPFYFHCHHGKHRGPAAAAVACIADGAADNTGAVAILELAQTSKDYAGLWRDVKGYAPPAAGTRLPELVEIAKVESLAAAMANIDRASDNLQLCQDAAWGMPQDHPDIVAAQEALLLKEGLREAARNLTAAHNDQFRTWMTESEVLGSSLEEALHAREADEATSRFQQLQQSCKRCHAKYRN